MRVADRLDDSSIHVGRPGRVDAGREFVRTVNADRIRRGVDVSVGDEGVGHDRLAVCVRPRSGRHAVGVHQKPNEIAVSFVQCRLHAPDPIREMAEHVDRHENDRARVALHGQGTHVDIVVDPGAEPTVTRSTQAVPRARAAHSALGRRDREFGRSCPEEGLGLRRREQRQGESERDCRTSDRSEPHGRASSGAV